MPFTPSDSEQRLHHTYYRGCWHVVSRCFGRVPSLSSSPSIAVYDPKAFIPHAASLRQGFPHCARFLTAASRRSLDRISVPVWPITLSGRLSIVALVSHYLTNKLIDRRLILGCPKTFIISPVEKMIICGISSSFPKLSPAPGQITYVLLTRLPLVTRSVTVRLACLRRAASVSSEPGSNSPLCNQSED